MRVGFHCITKTPWLVFELSCGNILVDLSIGTRKREDVVAARDIFKENQADLDTSTWLDHTSINACMTHLYGRETALL